MSDVKILSYYEDLFAQYVGSYGFTVAEAYCKAFSIDANQLNDVILGKAQRLYRKKHIKDKILEYRKKVEDKSIEIASGKVSFEKEDAIKNIQKVLQQCNTALNTPPITESKQEQIKEFLRRGIRKDDNGVPNRLDIALAQEIMAFCLKPELNHKVADVLLKANRQACELYNLVNTDVALKADETIVKLTQQLDKISEETLEKIAYPDRK